MESRLIQSIAKLIEIENEMALNESDGNFVRGSEPGMEHGGEIFYVFDHSVFELFINPDETRRKYGALFHRDFWDISDAEWAGRRDNPDRENSRKLTNEMLSVVAAEFLFSLRLPGQVGDKIFITPGHYFELSRSIALEREGDLDQQKQAERRNSMQSLAQDFEKSRDLDDGSDDHMDAYLAKDLDEIPAEDRDSFIRIRRMARFFAEHIDTSRQLQLARLGGLALQRLEDVFPLSQRDWDVIAEEAKFWRDKLEERLRGRSKDRSINRPQRGVWRDATSLAMLQFLARHRLGQYERIVFVTGDSAALETYWAWYAGAIVRDPTVPNIIRSIGRFSPVVNFSDMLKTAGENMLAPFKAMQVALAAAIEPWHMRIPSGSHRMVGEKIGNLWHFRQWLLDRETDPEELWHHGLFPKPAGWPSQICAAFEKMRPQLQTFERMSLTIGVDLLKDRWDIYARDLKPLIDAYDIYAGGFDLERVNAYFLRFERRLIQDWIVISLGEAWGFLKSGEKEADRVPSSARRSVLLRVPVDMRPEAADEPGQQLMSVEDFGAYLLANTEKQASIQLRVAKEYSHLVFVLSSVRAMECRLWSVALSYAGVAKKAYIYGREGPGGLIPPKDDGYQELRYLRALCARLALENSDAGRSASDASKTDGPGEVVRQRIRNFRAEYWERGRANLEKCINYHQQNNQSLRLARALLEFASLDLVTLFWRFVDAVDTPLMKEEKFLAGLRIDLLEVIDGKLLRAERQIGAPPLGTGEEAALRRVSRERLKDQVAINAVLIDMLVQNVGDLRPFYEDVAPLLQPLLAEAARWLPDRPSGGFGVTIHRVLSDFLERQNVATIGRPFGQSRDGSTRPTGPRIDSHIMEILFDRRSPLQSEAVGSA